MEKTAEELLSGEAEISWKANPNITPGLAEKLDEANQKYHMTVGELREAADSKGAGKQS